MESAVLLLGIDGGGTVTRGRLTDIASKVLGHGTAGPANLRFGIEPSFGAVFAVTEQCLASASLSRDEVKRIVACLALAGASEPTELAAAKKHVHPYRKLVITTDAHAACVGANAGKDGGAVIVGTGAIGCAIVQGAEYRCGGWGFPVSDEGSGAWLGCEAIRRVLWAHDGRIGWSACLRALFTEFQSDPHRIVHWMTTARPRDFARFAPLVFEHAPSDAVAAELVRSAAGHIDQLALRLLELGAPRLSLVGGLADKIEPFLAAGVKEHLMPPAADAVSGALALARAEAETLVAAKG
jgi:glucosamine kinase